MIELIKRLMVRPGVTTELMVATLFTNLLALASPLFVIQVLNRYVTFGVDATLRTLVFGVLIAIALEFGFREIRMRLAQGLAIKPDEALALAVFGLWLALAGSGWLAGQLWLALPGFGNGWQAGWLARCCSG